MIWARAWDDVRTQTATSATSAMCCAILVNAMTLFSRGYDLLADGSLPRIARRDLRRKCRGLLFELRLVESCDLYQLFRAVVAFDQADLVGLDLESLCEQVDDGLVRSAVLGG